MTPHPFTEDHLVERPAVQLFSELGWETVAAHEETFGPGGTLGRETPGEVVLIPRLRKARVLSTMVSANAETIRLAETGRLTYFIE